MSEQCKQRVYGGGTFMGHQCSRKAIKDGFCKQHHPDSVAARRKVEREKREKARENDPLRLSRTRIEALERQLSEAESKAVASGDAYNKLFDDRAGIIQELSEAEAAKWISVEDDCKPEMHERVLIYTTDCDGIPIQNMAHWNGDLGFLVSGGYKDPDVTYWMRVPAPPLTAKGRA